MCLSQHVTCRLDFCVLANARVLHECRAAAGEQQQHFNISCPQRAVIKVHSAEVGYNSHLHECQLHQPICKLSSGLDDVIRECNERTSCEFSQEVFHDAHCLPRQNRYVMKIQYRCFMPRSKRMFMSMSY